MSVPVPESGLAGDVRIAGPAVLLAVRTVGRNAGEVGKITLHGDLLQTVQRGVGRFELADFAEGVVNKLRLDGTEFRIFVPD